MRSTKETNGSLVYEAQMIRLEKKHKQWLKQESKELKLGISEYVRTLLEMLENDQTQEYKKRLRNMAKNKVASELEEKIRVMKEQLESLKSN